MSVRSLEGIATDDVEGATMSNHNDVNLAITLLFKGVGPDGERVSRVMERLMDAFPVGDPDRPAMFQASISRRSLEEWVEHVERWTLDSKKEDEMSLVKHGEGSVIPETDQQKTAAQSGEGLSAEAAEELRRENEGADELDGD